MNEVKNTLNEYYVLIDNLMQSLKMSENNKKMNHEYWNLYTGLNSLRKFLHFRAFVDEFKFNWNQWFDVF